MLTVSTYVTNAQTKDIIQGILLAHLDLRNEFNGLLLVMYFYIFFTLFPSNIVENNIHDDSNLNS